MPPFTRRDVLRRMGGLGGLALAGGVGRCSRAAPRRSPVGKCWRLIQRSPRWSTASSGSTCCGGHVAGAEHVGLGTDNSGFGARKRGLRVFNLSVKAA